jgi:hypothetical protein
MPSPRDPNLTSEPRATEVLDLTSAEADSPFGPVELFTATVAVSNARRPLQVTITDTTTGVDVWTGSGGASSFSFYAHHGMLFTPWVAQMPTALAPVDMAHTFSLTVDSTAPDGSQASASAVLSITNPAGTP